jgi:uncharacterized protein (TIGR02466 family)
VKDETKYTNLFGSPLVARVWKESDLLNDSLRDRIFAEELAATGLNKTNSGGWHSDTGQLEFCGDAGRQLIRRIYEMADEATRLVLAEYGQPGRAMRWSLQAWANVNRAGHFNNVHTHPGATWSGTYYVDDGDPPASAPNGTPIHFFDPCQARANLFFPHLVPSSMLVRPEAGLMVVFPAYLPHMVLPHEGKRPRVSIAFNLRKEPFP